MLKTALVIGLSVAAILTFGDGSLTVGDKIPENKFTEVIWGWDGAEGLQDYLGEPVLVDFWGKNCPPCIGEAVPHAIKIQEKFGDLGLHVLLVESQAHKRDEIVPFMAQYWSGRVPMGVLGTNSPFNLPGDTIPKAGLVGVDGKLIWTGAGGGGCEKTLEEQLSKLHQVKPLEGPLKPIAKDLNARNLGKAVTAARAIATKAPNDKVKADADALVAHLTKTVDNRIGMAKRVLATGRPVKAKAALTKLAKEVKDDKEWADRVAAELKEIDGGNKDEFAADKKVAEAEVLMCERKGRDGAATMLGEVVKKYPSAKIAKYAEELQGALLDKKALR